MPNINGSFTGVGVSAPIKVNAFDGQFHPHDLYFNASVQGGSGTVQLQRSFDKKVTWEVAEEITENTSKVGIEPEADTYYRFECTAFTSGPIVYRIGTSRRL